MPESEDDIRRIIAAETLGMDSQPTRRYTLRIEYDESPPNPLTDYEGSVTVLACAHSYYQLGTEQVNTERFNSWAGVAQSIRNQVEGGAPSDPTYCQHCDNDIELVDGQWVDAEGAVCEEGIHEPVLTPKTGDKVLAMLPLYLMDHSGLSIRTGAAEFAMIDSAGWDWGQVGIAYVTRQAMLESGFTEDQLTAERATEILNAEVEGYDRYLRGEAYGYIIEVHTTCNLGHEHAETVDSCWGFDDLDYCLSEALAAVPEGVTAERIGELVTYATERKKEGSNG